MTIIVFDGPRGRVLADKKVTNSYSDTTCYLPKISSVVYGLRNNQNPIEGEPKAATFTFAGCGDRSEIEEVVKLFIDTYLSDCDAHRESRAIKVSKSKVFANINCSVFVSVAHDFTVVATFLVSSTPRGLSAVRLSRHDVIAIGSGSTVFDVLHQHFTMFGCKNLAKDPSLAAFFGTCFQSSGCGMEKESNGDLTYSLFDLQTGRYSNSEVSLLSILPVIKG